VSDDCPECASPGRVVTVVTVRTLGTRPRTVLVTRLCTGPGCHSKYVLTKPEERLTAEERDLWHDP
jgi:hypothetical protein